MLSPRRPVPPLWLLFALSLALVLPGGLFVAPVPPGLCHADQPDTAPAHDMCVLCLCATVQAAVLPPGIAPLRVPSPLIGRSAPPSFAAPAPATQTAYAARAPPVGPRRLA